MRALAGVPGLLSAEYFPQAGLDLLVTHAGLRPPFPVPAPAYLLLEAAGPGAADDLAALLGDGPALADRVPADPVVADPVLAGTVPVGTVPAGTVAVADTAADRERLWAYRERMPEAAGFAGTPLKLDVAVPAAQWVRLATTVAGAVADADPAALVVAYGHVADGNLHVNVVPSGPADGRHEDAVFGLVASLGGSISAEHGIGALKAKWLGLARSPAEQALFGRIRAAFDPAGTLNPAILPRTRPPG